MPDKIIRLTVDEKFYNELTNCARREGFTRKRMTQFYRNAFEHYLTYLLDKQLDAEIEEVGVERIEKGLKRYYAKRPQEK
jgi:hypothetical protein